VKRHTVCEQLGCSFQFRLLGPREPAVLSLAILCSTMNNSSSAVNAPPAAPEAPPKDMPNYSPTGGL